jgi:hypothetical protein
MDDHLDELGEERSEIRRELVRLGRQIGAMIPTDYPQAEDYLRFLSLRQMKLKWLVSRLAVIEHMLAERGAAQRQ